MRLIFWWGASSVCLPPVRSCPDGKGPPASFWPPSNQQPTRFGIFVPASQWIDRAFHHSILASCLSPTCSQQAQWPVSQSGGVQFWCRQQWGAIEALHPLKKCNINTSGQEFMTKMKTRTRMLNCHVHYSQQVYVWTKIYEFYEKM